MSINEQTRQEHRESRPWVGADRWRLAGPWWVLLLTGIAWLIISVIVLRFRMTSVATIGVLMGVVFLPRWPTSS
jgi:uncharacterized membrane protein HdeD (DUF308 family)